MITIIVPCKNRLEKLEECINSIIGAISKAKNEIADLQTELIVVNDHSEEGFSDKVREKFNDVIVIDSDGMGPGYARNFGIKNSKGEYIFFTDSDCIVDESWIIEGYKMFKEKKPLSYKEFLGYFKRMLIRSLEKMKKNST